VSLGAAEADRDMADVEDWIQKADAALYDAKATGRDRLVSAPTVGVSQRHDDNAMSQQDQAEATASAEPARRSVAA
jgi:predicted signal transduction protein with EAL and GGDEF domain